MPQAQAAQVVGLTQPRLSELLQGRLELFSLDALVKIAARVDLTVRLTATRPYGRGQAD